MNIIKLSTLQKISVFVLLIGTQQVLGQGSLSSKTPLKENRFSLSDYLTPNNELDKIVDSIWNAMSTKQRVSQLLMPAVGRYGQHQDTIKAYIEDGLIGGILLLNGTKTQFSSWVKQFNAINERAGNLPFLYSADAEPSLVNRKIINSTPVKKASQINTLDEVQRVAKTISKDLTDIGINFNFAPVVDLSANKTVGYRGFGSNPENVIPFSNAFIEETQRNHIIATAKHFPGHGLVSGDTHKSLQVIDGDLKELDNYPPLIENGVLSIMIAHIAVRNNSQFSTEGMPSTTSKKIVTNLLRDSLGFKGLIVTDAMNMGGVTQVINACVKAAEAGCDILLMPLRTRESHSALKANYLENESFRITVDESVKRIIRAKLCLGIFN